MWSQWLQNQKIDHGNRITHEKWLVAVLKNMGKAARFFLGLFPVFATTSLVGIKTEAK